MNQPIQYKTAFRKGEGEIEREGEIETIFEKKMEGKEENFDKTTNSSG